jgi:UDP-GlcNAc:undecaprenyl-phosphate GlcNAc-1-phosphate transferase
MYSEPLYAGLLAVVIALVATPIVMRISVRIGAVDMPEERRVHTRPTPRMGGVAIAVAMLVSAVALVDWHVGDYGTARIFSDQMIATLIGAVLVVAIGAHDDAKGLVWWQKLSAQIGATLFAILAPLLGAATSVQQLILPVRRLDGPFIDPIILPWWLAVGIAAFWIVAVMNMVNFIDGVDGLAAGTCAIASGTFAIVAASYGRHNIAVLAAATCGAAVGFLRYNFKKNGADVFMGDAGSMLLGYLLAVIAIQGVLKTAAAVSLAIPFAMLAVPILDMAFVVAKRLKYGQSIASPDRWHLHHRLLNVGYSPRRVTVSFWLWSGAMSIVALALRYVHYKSGDQWNTQGLVLLGLIISLAVLVSVYVMITLEIVKLRHVRERNARIAAERQKQQS